MVASWLSRIILVKMTLLPKILDLFRVLPVSVLPYYLLILQWRVNTYIWDQVRTCCLGRFSLNWMVALAFLILLNMIRQFSWLTWLNTIQLQSPHCGMAWKQQTVILWSLTISAGSTLKNTRQLLTLLHATFWPYGTDWKRTCPLQSPHIPLLSFLNKHSFHIWK